MPSSHLILYCPLLLLPPIPPSIRVFSNESTRHMRWPKYWSFSFSIIPSKEIPGLIFRIDWLDLLAVQETLKSILQHHSSKSSILWYLALFIAQLSHPYMTTGKIIALIILSIFSKVMSLLMIQDAWGWCMRMIQRDGMGREVGGGFRMGNMCTPVAESCWCMATSIKYCKVISLQLK